MNQPNHQFKAAFFKVLSHPARLAIISHLRSGEKSVNQLQTLLQADQSAISQQLSRLRSGNIVDTRKEGTTVYYSVRDPLIFELMDVARAIFNRHLINHREFMEQVVEEAYFGNGIDAEDAISFTERIAETIVIEMGES